MLSTMRGRVAVLVVALGMIGVACGSDDGGSDEGASSTTTTAAVEAAAAGIDPARAQALVETLAADDLEGRDNQTPGSEATQAYLVEGRNRVRVHEPSGEPPPGHFQGVAPTLEDAYLVLMRLGALPGHEPLGAAAAGAR